MPSLVIIRQIHVASKREIIAVDLYGRLLKLWHYPKSQIHLDYIASTQDNYPAIAISKN